MAVLCRDERSGCKWFDENCKGGYCDYKGAPVSKTDECPRYN